MFTHSKYRNDNLPGLKIFDVFPTLFLNSLSSLNFCMVALSDVWLLYTHTRNVFVLNWLHVNTCIYLKSVKFLFVFSKVEESDITLDILAYVPAHTHYSLGSSLIIFYSFFYFYISWSKNTILKLEQPSLLT